MIRARGRWQPRASVIIASYRWPEALRLSLAGALAQTVVDLEVLVIEDGPDQASRAVVREVGDQRVRWMRLRHSSGSQAGPNALGCREARAPVIAYLGHDDLWHPEHLASLLSVLDPTVDLAHAVTLCLDASPEGRRAVAGTHAFEPSTFVPPSSIAHWRKGQRIGRWRAPGRTGMPVDHPFLMACHARGARFASSGVPTVFKYPAAWLVDSYRTRNVTAQVRLRDRLAANPMLGQDLLRQACDAGVPGDISAPAYAPPGVIADYNRRIKGLPARFGPPLRIWRPGEWSLPFPGWHAVERDALGSFAWTGPGERSFVRMDAPGGTELGVRIVVRHVFCSEQLERLVVELDGAPVQVTRQPGPHGGTVLTGWLGRRAREQTVDVGLTTVLARPSDHDPSSHDARMLGAAVSEIELLGR